MAILGGFSDALRRLKGFQRDVRGPHRLQGYRKFQVASRGCRAVSKRLRRLYRRFKAFQEDFRKL